MKLNEYKQNCSTDIRDEEEDGPSPDNTRRLSFSSIADTSSESDQFPTPSMPISFPSLQDDEEEEREARRAVLAKRYDQATWKMYHR